MRSTATFFAFLLGAPLLLPAPARAEIAARCWPATAPTLEQYMQKLESGDICEQNRVPESCEIKVTEAVMKRLGRGYSLSTIDMDHDRPMTTIDLGISKGDCLKAGTVTVKYGYLGTCTIEEIRIDSDDQLDCG